MVMNLIIVMVVIIVITVLIIITLLVICFVFGYKIIKLQKQLKKPDIPGVQLLPATAPADVSHHDGTN